MPMHMYAGIYIQIHAPIPEKNTYFNHFSVVLECCLRI